MNKPQEVTFAFFPAAHLTDVLFLFTAPYLHGQRLGSDWAVGHQSVKQGELSSLKDIKRNAFGPMSVSSSSPTLDTVQVLCSIRGLLVQSVTACCFTAGGRGVH